METIDELKEMIGFLEDKIENMSGTIFNLRTEIDILTSIIRDMEKELNNG